MEVTCRSDASAIAFVFVSNQYEQATFMQKLPMCAIVTVPANLRQLFA